MPQKTKSQKNLKSQINELEEKLKRVLADYQNLEKRVEKTQSSFIKMANASLIDKLLSVLDDLERAQNHLNDKGLALVLSQFKSVLETEGLKPINALNEIFNPETMDCVEMTKGPENIVAKVTQKGYYLYNKVLRPAKVKVGKGERS